MAHSKTSSMSSSPCTSNSSSSTSVGPKMHHQKSQSALSKMCAKVKLVFSYGWLFIQLILLVAALTVLHFSTFMVTLSYWIYGHFKRHEFKHQGLKV